MTKLLNQDGQYTRGREMRWKEGNDIILERLKTLKSEGKLRVLDIGSGETYNYKILNNLLAKRQVSSKKLEYYAVDNNPKLEKILKNTGVNFCLGDIKSLVKLYPKKYFDVIIASEIIEHLVDTDNFLLSIKKILKDDGEVFLTTPNLGSWHSILSLVFGYQPLSTEVSCVRSEFGKFPFAKKYYTNNVLMHIRSFTLHGLTELLEFHGFSIKKIRGGGYRRIDNLLFSKVLIGLSPILKVIIKKNV